MKVRVEARARASRSAAPLPPSELEEEPPREGRRDAPEEGAGSPSLEVTCVAPTRTGVERFVSSREIGLAEPPTLPASAVAERSRTNAVARPITECVRRMAAGRFEPELCSPLLGLVVASASDDGATSVKVRGVACTGTVEVVATTGTAGGDVLQRAVLESDMPAAPAASV